MKIWNAAVACGALALGSVAGAYPAQAQGTTFPDVPANHWAYQAVQDLADKGYVKGYPDGKFLGKRDLTRYEFATVIDRIVQTVTDLNTKVGALPATPTGTPVTQDDLNKIQALVDSFRTQLDTIQTNVSGLTDQLDALRQDVLDTKAIAVKAQSTADAAYSSNPKAKFTISGYVQARGVNVSSGAKNRFPQGTDNLSGAYNGNYAQGGTTDSLQVRRARLKVAGAVTSNTKYGVQIDLSGSTGSGGNQQVTTREAYVAYTFGDGTAANNPTLTAGLFATPFGYILPVSSSTYLTPERPLAFSENGTIGLFNGQDYDKGVQIGYQTPQQLLFFPAGIKLTYALVNGAGRNSENLDRRLDSIARVAYSTPDKVFNIGASYYDGQVERAKPAGIPATAFTYNSPQKKLFGLDAQIALPSGPFVNAEYVAGTYEQRTYFANTAANLTGLVTDGYVKHNQVTGWYLQGGYTFSPTGNHPLTLAVNYDKFLRSHSAQANGANAIGGNTVNGAVPLTGASYDDVNFGYGVLYNLDKATRLRLWYDHPISVAHSPTTGTPPRIDLFTTELQVKF